MKPEDFDDTPVQEPIRINDPGGLLKYAGKVIAVVDGEVRAVGSTWTECLRAVQSAKLSDPRLLFIPQGGFIG